MEAKKQYTKEFKLDAISLVLDQGFTIAEAARSLGIRAEHAWAMDQGEPGGH